MVISFIMIILLKIIIVIKMIKTNSLEIYSTNMPCHMNYIYEGEEKQSSTKMTFSRTLKIQEELLHKGKYDFL